MEMRKAEYKRGPYSILGQENDFRPWWSGRARGEGAKVLFRGKREEVPALGAVKIDRGIRVRSRF